MPKTPPALRLALNRLLRTVDGSFQVPEHTSLSRGCPTEGQSATDKLVGGFYVRCGLESRRARSATFLAPRARTRKTEAGGQSRREDGSPMHGGPIQRPGLFGETRPERRAMIEQARAITRKT
jgi:hypothetical protein